MMPSIAIFVDSFDGYRDVWPVFGAILNKYWPHSEFKRYIVSNNIKCDVIGFDSITTGDEVDWFDRTIRALEQVDEEYIVFFLEDYFVSKVIHDTKIVELVKRMQAEKIYYYRLSERNGFKKNCSFLQVPTGTSYAISLQPAIWERKVFLSLLKSLRKLGASSPWDFEILLKDGEKLSTQFGDFIEGIAYDTTDILGYKNGILRGKWFPIVKLFYSRKGIDFSCSTRKSLSVSYWFRYEIASWISFKAGGRTKGLIKSILRRLNLRDSL